MLGVQAQLIEAESRLGTTDLQTANEVDAMRIRIAEIDQQVATTETRRSIEVHAPGAGNVTAIAVHPGQTISSGARMLTIVPENGKMQAELLAPSSAIAFLRPGERVLLRYSAFPYQRFGEHPGIVTEVSRAALHPEELKALMPEDVKEAIGHGVRAKRAKSGAVSFEVLDTEAARASLQ